jgi:hypothetical protein
VGNRSLLGQVTKGDQKSFCFLEGVFSFGRAVEKSVGEGFVGDQFAEVTVRPHDLCEFLHGCDRDGGVGFSVEDEGGWQPSAIVMDWGACLRGAGVAEPELGREV